MILVGLVKWLNIVAVAVVGVIDELLGEGVLAEGDKLAADVLVVDAEIVLLVGVMLLDDGVGVDVFFVKRLSEKIVKLKKPIKNNNEIPTITILWFFL